MNILLVCAHPDDEVIGMAGTLKKLSKKNKIKVIFLAEGNTSRRRSGYKNVPVYDIPSEEEAKLQEEIKIRNEHAKKALDLLGVRDIRFLDHRNLETHLLPPLKLIKEIEKEIIETKCDIIFTHHYNDLNVDHRVAYESVITAARPLPGSSTSGIFSFEIPAATDWKYPYKFNPNFFVDITNEIQAKIDALKIYQYEIRKGPNPRSVETTMAIAKRWGSLSGFEAAEAFEIVRLRMRDFEKFSF